MVVVRDSLNLGRDFFNRFHYVGVCELSHLNQNAFTFWKIGRAHV